MRDLSLHILDLAQNSLRAGARVICITVDENFDDDLLMVRISDNGKGISAQDQKKIFDPFYSTRVTRRIGLGLALLQASAQRSGGEVNLESTPGKGTTVTATFAQNNWDRPPLGDIPETMISLVAANPEIDFVYLHRRKEKEYLFDTRIIRSILEEVSIATPSVLEYLRGELKTGIENVQSS